MEVLSSNLGKWYIRPWGIKGKISSQSSQYVREQSGTRLESLHSNPFYFNSCYVRSCIIVIVCYMWLFMGENMNWRCSSTPDMWNWWGSSAPNIDVSLDHLYVYSLKSLNYMRICLKYDMFWLNVCMSLLSISMKYSAPYLTISD